MEAFLMNYGLLAVFVCAMVEADVVPVLAGVVAHLGYFDFIEAVAVAAAGAFIGDCVWFYLGHARSERIRRSWLYARAGKLTESLDRRFGKWLIPASHVIYGTRVATMTLSGIRRMPFAQFAAIDMLGCLTFTTLLASMGFLFSSSASLIIGHVKRVEVLLLIVAVLTALGFHLLRVIAERQADSSEKDVKRA
jgi:membrane protein DedA with SNARE-associated domain